MISPDRRRPVSLLALLATAIATGAFAGAIAAGFIWLVETGTEFMWVDLPERVGVDGFDSWWLFAVPIIGGGLVGLGQLVLGNYPKPIDAAVETWRSGGHIEPDVAPRTACNSLVALVAGGPVGFEAALTGLLGGTASWIGARIGAVGQLVREAWGAERVDSLPRTVRQLPYWLAALAGLFTFRWLPFGGIDMGFRFDQFDGRIGVTDGIVIFVFGALVTVPTAWAIATIVRAERATYFSRSPILIGMAGGFGVALLAVPNSLVLFSGQQGIRLLPETGNADLLYITIAKWLALVIALYAGWRGGPIFPTYTAVAALAVLIDGLVGIGPDLMMVAGIAAVSAVFVKGSIPIAFVLTLYPVPLSYVGAILLGCVGAAVALAVARSANLLPTPTDDVPHPAGAAEPA